MSTNSSNFIVEVKKILLDQNEQHHFSQNPELLKKEIVALEKIEKIVSEKYFKRKDIESFINTINKILLKYAQHKYNVELNFTKNDILDSLLSSIDLLGEELNYSTVTTHYLEDVFNSIGDMILVVDKMGYVLFVNKTTRQILGYKEKEIKRKHITMILDKGIEYNSLIENRAKRKFYNFLTKNNVNIPVSLNITEFSRKDNPFMGHVIIARDISLTLKYEKEIEDHNKQILNKNEELKVALDKAEESERLKSSFLANMSHEIRTPLNGIMGFSELMQQPDNTKEDYRKFGKIIIDCGNQLLGIVNNVLDISKIEASLMQVSKDRFNINLLLDELFVVYKQKISASQKEIHFDLFKGLSFEKAHIISDELRLRQIISNFLDNAIKFTDSGSIMFGYALINENLHFTIKDTGIGISKDKIDVVFKPFMQAAKSTTKLYGGTGLGLAISKGLIQLLSGEIHVESELNKGSTFSFSIPYTVDTKPPIKQSDAFDLELYNWKNRNILLIEDDFNSSNLIKQLILPTQANLLNVQFGEEALEILKIKNDINLVIMDFKLPDIDGIEVIKRIREMGYNMPCIVQTAFASPEDKKMCLEAGFNFYMSKPIKSNFLLSLIASYFVNIIK